LKRLVLLSGHIGSGKSELAAGLVDRYGARHIKTRALLEATLGVGRASSRGSLQAEGSGWIGGRRGRGWPTRSHET
jgi:adenylosuccinate synthase